MRKLPIAYGNSCFAKTWPNKTITFDELCARLEHTIRTTETAEEYPKLPKAERDRIKDKGGFVGGQLRDNRRKRETVVVRSLLTLDCDHAETDFISRFTASCEYAACLYTTHGHTPEAPRVRIVLPTTRDITHDEYAAIARYFADEWGIDQFDECSYLPHQLMYWPTTPSNGEYVFKRIDGPWLDPDAYLAAHPSGFLFITLPSGRHLAYVKPRIGENRFGGESVTYEGVGNTKKWDRIESYGPKFVENIVQATARDILAEAMLRLDTAGYRIVMHVHDEVVIEAPGTASLEDICAIMGQTPAWAKGFMLRADGFVCDYYKKS